MSSATKGYFIITLAVIVTLFVIYSAMQNREEALSTILVPYFLGAMLLLPPLLPDLLSVQFRRGEQVNTSSGVAGTMKGIPIETGQGWGILTLKCDRSAVSKQILETYEDDHNDWGSSLYDAITMTATLRIPIQLSLLQRVHQKDCENPHGSLIYYGKLNGTEMINSKESFFVDTIKQLSATLVELQTAVVSGRKDLQYLAEQSISNLQRQVEQAAKIAKPVKSTTILTKGSGGMEAMMQDMNK